MSLLNFFSTVSHGEQTKRYRARNHAERHSSAGRYGTVTGQYSLLIQRNNPAASYSAAHHWNFSGSNIPGNERSDSAICGAYSQVFDTRNNR